MRKHIFYLPLWLFLLVVGILLFVGSCVGKDSKPECINTARDAHAFYGTEGFVYDNFNYYSQKLDWESPQALGANIKACKAEYK